MSLVTLRDLYLAEANELYDAEQQVLRELPLLASAASADELREAFDLHYRQTLRHIDRLDEIFVHLDERPRPVSGRSLRAIIEDGRLRKAYIDRGAVLDAALISFGQRLAHFEIAAYRAAHTYAATLGDVRGADLLKKTLDEEGGMDERLLELGTQKPGLALAGVLRRA